MLRKRIIFTLIHSDGYFMQSRNFRLQKVGNLLWLEKNYKFQHISFSLDELIILDATRNQKNLSQFASIVSGVVNDVFIPVAAGGGIRSLADADLLFKSGADKIVLNSLQYENPLIVRELVEKYGSQSIIASVDYKSTAEGHLVYVNDGSKKIEYSLKEYLTYLEDLGVGEIYLNSIDKDGTGFGYDLETILNVKDLLSIPLIIAGGAGNEKHLLEGLKTDGIAAVATANLFNFIGDGLPNARNHIISLGENIANWNANS
ncbi:HisA/HisF-related TIM barrel protein [Pedobacter sp. JY14-1]|uniref:HisA/HisF-related TIM barrel protein n=1 Tax=Pedobacter sp. JY14-1 TaxID=3034151 RepID=UPI0023E1B021|nr:HisA/HisF-related TIM barrel protein [Pedobacter sp. JY14-1]